MRLLKDSDRFWLKDKLYLLSQKRIQFPLFCDNKIEVSNNDLMYFTLSANTITIVHNSKGDFFYRQVMCHKSKPIYFKTQIDLFMEIAERGVAKINFEQDFPIRTQFDNEYIESFSLWMNERMKERHFYRKISYAYYVLKENNYNIWRTKKSHIGNDTLTRIGLCGLCDEFTEIAPLFLSFISGASYCYVMNGYSKYETFFAQKSVSSYIVAKSLQLEALLAPAIPSELIVDKDRHLWGVLSPRVLGVRAKDTQLDPTPEIQRDLARLEVLDYLCCQTDHKPNNYNVSFEKGDSCVFAFDNDNQFTFYPIFNPRLYKGAWFSNYITNNGIINRPHFDKTTAKTILNTSCKDICVNLRPWLNFLQMAAFKSRFYILQTALKKTIENNSSFLLEKDEWSSQTMNEELEGGFGETYLYSFVNRHN